MPEREYGLDEEVATESREKLKKPPLFRVLLHNDDFTTMEFVVEVLKTVFGKSDGDAFQVMWAVHTQGVGVAGGHTRAGADGEGGRVPQMAPAAGVPPLRTLAEGRGGG